MYLTYLKIIKLQNLYKSTNFIKIYFIFLISLKLVSKLQFLIISKSYQQKIY